MYPPRLLLSCSRAARTLTKDLGISHTTVLRKLEGLLDGHVVDF
jgi:predicted ArsR family transcriptional regulator